MINEVLGVSSLIEEPSKTLSSFILSDLLNKNYTPKIYQGSIFFKSLLINNLSIIYDKKSNDEMSVEYDTKLKNIVLSIHKYDLSEQEIYKTLMHELTHVLGEYNGHTDKSFYKKILYLLDILNKDSYSYKFIYMVYLSQDTEINSMISELWSDINYNITNKSEFNKYIINNQLYKNSKYMIEFKLDKSKISNDDLVTISKYIKTDKCSKIINIKGEDLRRRILRLSTLFDQKY
jgi:hypothetical protein